MSNARTLLSLLLLSCSACTTHLGAGTGRPARAVQVPDFTVRKDIIYSPAGWPQALPADLYQPKGTGPWPGVLLIHGGSWTGADHRSQMASIARRLARRGYVVMNATYRLAPQFLYPAQVKDLQQATKWLRDHAQELNLRADRVGTFGYSAGGNLAALIAAIDAPASLRFGAVVAGGAPTDLRKFPDSPVVEKYLGGLESKIPGAFADASPITHISRDDPPVFLYHGTRDTLVPVDQAADYQAALQRKGVPHELLWQNGRGHVTAYFFDHDAVSAAIDFLDRHLRS
jgi:acetyl esterase/lipase